MQESNNYFKNKKMITHKLLEYGFVKDDDKYIYHTMIFNNFNLCVSVDQNSNIDTELIDTETNDIYILHKVANATGAYVTQIREEYQNILSDIANKCFENHVFKSKQACEIIEYVKEKYNDELQFLWKNLNSAVLKRSDNQKWYAVFMLVQKDKLGLQGKDLIEVIDLRIDPKELTILVDYQIYFPGYHMNKKNWLTICLNDSVSIEEIKERIDTSYMMANR